MMKLVGMVAAGSVLAGASLTAAADRLRPHVVHVAIYRGPASCEDCSEAIGRSIAKLGPRYHVDYVGPGERIDITPATLRHYQVYVQPGGGQDIDAALDSLGRQRVAAIHRFVVQGGNYLGICMGAYLAGASNIGLIGDDLDSEVRRPGFAVKTTDDRAVAVRWSGKPQNLYYQDGPFLHAEPADPSYRPIATYQNGDVAAARYSLGKGRVVLSGPHPEADRSWFDDAQVPAEAMPTGTPFKALLDQLRT